jgi:hypothetical protein
VVSQAVARCSECWAGGLGETDVRHDAVGEKGRGAATRAIEKLVRDHKVEWRDVLTERADRADGKDALGAQHFERADIGAVVDVAGRKAMAAAVPRQERDATAFELSNHDCIGRVAKRRLHADFARVGEAGHVIEAAPADDGDLHRFFFRCGFRFFGLRHSGS